MDEYWGNMTGSACMKAARALLGIVAISTACSGCAFGLMPLSADPIDSQVVDADTGAPIEGAVVLARWELSTGSLSGDSLPCGVANVEDAVTDKDGKFHLPGWGPSLPGCSGEMTQGNPHLYVFKPGYHYLDVPNGLTSIHDVMTTHNAWKDKELELTIIRDRNAPYDSHSLNNPYVNNLSSLETAITLFIKDMPEECNWKKAPNMMRAIALQQQAFLSEGINYGGMLSVLIANDQWYQQMAPKCGSPKEFIAGLLK